MLQKDPEAQALRSCHHALQRVNHLSFSKGQSQGSDMEYMLIGYHLTAYCSLCVTIFEIAQLSIYSRLRLLDDSVHAQL